MCTVFAWYYPPLPIPEHTVKFDFRVKHWFTALMRFPHSSCVYLSNGVSKDELRARKRKYQIFNFSFVDLLWLAVVKGRTGLDSYNV